MTSPTTSLAPTTSCPEDGELQAWIDGESPTAAALDEHVSGCTECGVVAHDLRAAGAVVAGALDTLDAAATPVAPAASTDAATPTRRAAPPTAAADPVARVVPLRPRPASRTWQRVTGVAAGALLLAGVISTPNGRSAAAAFLDAFRSERLEVVGFDPDGMDEVWLEQLADLGTVVGQPPYENFAEVATLADAEQITGFAPTPVDPATVPARFAGPTRILAAPGSEVRFTFDADRAAATLGSVTVPPGIDGTTLIVRFGPAVVVEHTADGGEDGLPGLFVGEAGAVTATTEGATLDELRSFLLGLPGLPEDLRSQLAGIEDWRSTLPLPVPVEYFEATDTTVAGVPAVALRERSGLGNGLLWQRDGRIHAVAGLADDEEVRGVADSLG